MRSTFSGLNTVTLGLAAQQLSLDTVGHNISNANTPGYSRQTVNLVTTRPDNFYANGTLQAVGSGVTEQSITRARDALIDKQYWQQNSAQNYWQNNSDVLGKVEDIFHDTKDAGITSAINNFSTALQTLASDSGNDAARTNVRETANALVQTLDQDDQHLKDLANDITSQISTQVTNINNMTSQIASLNKQISLQIASGITPNDLRDKRDYLVDQMSAIAKVQVYEDKNGAYTVSIQGATLVQGSNSIQLQAVPLVAGDANYNNSQLYGFSANKVVIAGTTTQISFTGGVSSGTMQSLFESRDNTLVGYFSNLDKMAQYLMQNFNTQHKAGLDNEATPKAGDNFFGATGVDYTTGKAQVTGVSVAAAGIPAAGAGTFTVNLQTITVAAGDTAATIVANPANIAAFAAAGVTATATAAGELVLTQNTAGAANSITLGGTAAVLSALGLNANTYTGSDAGTGSNSWMNELMVNSDFYATNGTDLIAARGTSSGGPADGTNATSLSNVLLNPPAAASAALGNQCLNDFYGSMISALGVNSQQATNTNSNQQILLNSTSNWRQSVSGVNMDEEMSNMIKFQQAYGAAAKVLSTIDAMIGTLIAAPGAAT